jgi:vesicle coat complex subunit
MRTWRRFKVKERQRLNCVQRFQKWKYDDSDTSYTMQIEYRTSNREDDLYDLMTVFLTLTRHEKTQNRSETILALNGYRWTNEKTRYVSFDTLESIIKQMSTTIRQIVHAAPVV